MNGVCDFEFTDRQAVSAPLTDPAGHKGLNPCHPFCGCDFKKCCKKYKKGNRCKKCPKR